MKRNQLWLRKEWLLGPPPGGGTHNSLERDCGAIWPGIRVVSQDSSSSQDKRPRPLGVMRPSPWAAPKPSPEQLLLVSVQPRPQQPLLPVPGPLIPTVTIGSAVP